MSVRSCGPVVRAAFAAAAVDGVLTAVGSIGDQSAAAAVELVGDQVGELTESATALVDEVSSSCA